MEEVTNGATFLGGHCKKLQALGWSTAYSHMHEDHWVLYGQKGFVKVRISYIVHKSDPFKFRATLSDLHDPPREKDWRVVREEEDFWEYVHTYDHDLLVEPQVDLAKPDEPQPEPPAKAPKPARPTCHCGKYRFTFAAAHEALLKAKIARALRGNMRRRERRVYECPTLPEVFHLTSWEERHKPARGGASAGNAQGET